MKNKKLTLILLIGICMFIGMNSVFAADAKKGSCMQYKDPVSCKAASDYSCVWVEATDPMYKNRGIKTSFCNTNDLVYVSCGSAVDIPRQVPKVFSVVLSVFYLGVPVVLIITSMITLIGAISSNSEDEISKAKNKLFKKMIAAILVFLVIGIVKFAISLVPESEGGVKSSELAECLDCFLNDSCGGAYIKTEVNGKWEKQNLSSLN